MRTSVKRPNRQIRRLMPGLESLEGRQLMATLATTLDASNNPVIFSIQPGGVVTDTRQVATNIQATPYRSNGLETLGGLDATSIAAYQLPNGAPVVVAMTGPESYVYLDEYEATNTPSDPYAWSGWVQTSTFVAKSIIAVGAKNEVGPAIFAIGADNNVYEDLYSGTNSPGPYTDFQILPGLSATSLAASYDTGSTFSVFALVGPDSYVFQDTTTLVDSAITTSGWSPVSSLFVASSISVSEGPSSPVAGMTAPDSLMLFATGAGDGNFYDDGLVLNTQTGIRTGAGFGIVSLQPYIYNVEYQEADPTPVTPFVASTATNSGDYLTVFALGANGDVYENQFLYTGLTDTPSYWVGWQTVNVLSSNGQVSSPVQATEIDSSISLNGGVEVVTNNASDIPEISSAPVHAGLSFPGYAPIANNLSFAVPLPATGSHPIVTTVGVNGRPVVFTIGSDGTVYDSQDLATGTGPTTTQDPYSALAAIPGVAATSLAATTEPDGIALFALTANISLVFENQYRPTGSGGAYAWTGWEAIGSFTARSITAATGGDSAQDGPTVFAIGADGNAYADASTLSTPSTGYTFGTFAVLPGLSAASLSAVSTSSGIELAALTGPMSYPYADLDTAGTWSGWQLTGNYVMSTFQATTSATGAPAVAGFSPLGGQAVSTYDSSSGWGAFISIPFDSFVGGEINLGYSQVIGFAGSSLPDQEGVTYLALLEPTRLYSEILGIYSAYILADGTRESGNNPIDAMAANTFALAPNTLQPTYYVVGMDGKLYVNQAVAPAVADPDAPYNYLGYVSLGALPS